MNLENTVQLTYCTNIHAGETWPEVFQSLKDYVQPLKKVLSPTAPFAIGLRLSDQASRALAEPLELAAFKQWLTDNALYVFTMNGFPYGGFHHQRVKDDVHRPDWTTPERRDYTIRLAKILAALPNGPSQTAGISTSPLSYRGWFTQADAYNTALQQGCVHMAEVVKELVAISLATGKVIHIDIEPEPDGFIDHVQDTIDFFNRKLIPIVSGYLVDALSVKPEAAEELARTHLQLCYDVCHFAVMYEEPEAAIQAFAAAGIRIGKVQISAALKADLPLPVAERTAVADAFANLAESTYLHQVVARPFTGKEISLLQYPDLPNALPDIYEPVIAEWRTHFHVPIFIKNYGVLQSTQEDIQKIVALQKAKPFADHWEVETYTWEVLPAELKISLLDSIEREMKWVLAQFAHPPQVR